eukprot:1144290-Pelagomonas_calceolata.AAC.3
MVAPLDAYFPLEASYEAYMTHRSRCDQKRGAEAGYTGCLYDSDSLDDTDTDHIPAPCSHGGAL